MNEYERKSTAPAPRPFLARQSDSAGWPQLAERLPAGRLVWRERREIAQFLRFCIIGTCTAMVYVGLFYLFADLFGLARFVASVLAYAGAISFQYVGHSTFTFRRTMRDQGQIGRFIASNAFGCAFAAVVTELLPRVTSLSVHVAVGVVVVALPVMNWLIFRYWVFSRRSRAA